ncbi:MAG: tetratricopeptide repeat protein [Planctomycetota bacterium]
MKANIVGLITSLFRRKHDSVQEQIFQNNLLQDGREEDLLRVVKQLMDGNQLERALVLLRVGASRFPDCDAVTELLASVERSMAMPAISATLELLHQNRTPDLLARLADLHRRAGEQTQAMEYGREAIQADPEGPGGYHAVGSIYLDQFRKTMGSVEGMNALRHLSKAHVIDPSNSMCLLQLAEIFLLLGAPSAADKFLRPVQSVFPHDPLVMELLERGQQLPPEETSHIQDLFLRHERRQRGPAPPLPVTDSTLRLPDDMDSKVESIVRGFRGSHALYIVGADRTLAARHNNQGWEDEGFGETLGLLAETARENSNRMGIGAFERLLIQGPDQLTIIKAFSEDLTVFFFGEKPGKQEEIELSLDCLRESLKE